MRATEIARIGDQLRRGFDGDAWHGTPLRRLLDSIDHQQAAAHPVYGAHSIWELAAHITFWLEVAKRRIDGESVHGQAGEDWVTSSAASNVEGWIAVRAGLEAAHTALLARVASLSDADLDRQAADMPYTIYVLLHGVLQHNLYHAGQIAMLRRAMDIPS